jgi:hypothetical protein
VPQRLAIFAYGSLASLASAERTLGRPVHHLGLARLSGWRRRWSQVRDNLRCEKTFARAGDGTEFPFCLGLNVERAPGPGPNGVLFEVSEAELERLAQREIRYDPVEVRGQLAGEATRALEVITFTAKLENHADTPPTGAVILASYSRAVEAAFRALGREQLELFRETTDPHPVEVVEGVLVRDHIPAGNPRDW